MLENITLITNLLINEEAVFITSGIDPEYECN